MDFDAITMDTSTFECQNFNLENGLLAKFEQFSRIDDVSFIMSEIVLQEMFSHMKEKTKTSVSEYKKALQNGMFYKIDDTITKEKITSIKSLNIKEIVKKRIENYIDRTGLQIISCEEIDIQEIIKRYFSRIPPFSEKKKEEFPDALALQSLENWAANENKKVLVISGDKDWQAYCQDNVNLICVKTIEDALSSLYKSQDFVLQRLKDIFSDKEKYEGIMQNIDETIMNSSDKLSINLDIISSYKYEEDYFGFDFQEVYFPDIDGIEIIDMNNENNNVTISIPAEITFFVEGEYTFYLTDEGDDIKIGDNSFNNELDFNTNLIISMNLNKEELSDSEIVSVDFKDYTMNYSLQLEPDFSEDEYDYCALEQEPEDIR